MAVSGCFRRRFLVTAGAVAAAPFIKLGCYKAFAGSIEGLDHPRKMYDITETLIRRGYSDGNLGGNFRRALGAIWLS